jgi:hypothetical protein
MWVLAARCGFLQPDVGFGSQMWVFAARCGFWQPDATVLLKLFYVTFISSLISATGEEKNPASSRN